MLRFVENLDVLNDARSRRSTPQLKQNTLEMGKVLEMLLDAPCRDDPSLVLFASQSLTELTPREIFDSHLFVSHRPSSRW